MMVERRTEAVQKGDAAEPRDHPLSHGHRRDDVIDEMGGGLGEVAARTALADAALYAAVDDRSCRPQCALLVHPAFLGIVDAVIEEPHGGAHRDPRQMATKPKTFRNGRLRARDTRFAACRRAVRRSRP